MPLSFDFERIARFVKERVPVDVCERMRAQLLGCPNGT